jgi:transposase
MDLAYEGDETRGLASLLGCKPVVPPNPQRLKPWKLDKAVYWQRNHVVRLFRRLKGFRRIFTRYDKLDVLFRSFVTFALIWLVLMWCKQALVRWEHRALLRRDQPVPVFATRR